MKIQVANGGSPVRNVSIDSPETAKDAAPPQDSFANSRPTVSNNGFFSKKVPVSFEKPVMENQTLGTIPGEGGYDSPKLTSEGFVPSTKENPVLLAGYGVRRVDQENPKLDAAGKPVMEPIYKVIEVPGPKAQALANVGNRTGAGAVYGMLAGLVPAGFIGIMSLGDIDGPFGPALCVMGGCMAIGAAIGLTRGLCHIKDYSQPNVLQWENKDITTTKFKGFNQSYEQQHYGAPIAKFEPVLESTKLGTWAEPQVVPHPAGTLCGVVD